jgi:galactokinase
MVDVQALRASFETTYGCEASVFTAPGRVNLIGEHTDYNDGFVLPMAIERHTAVAAAARSDRKVRVQSLDEGGSFEFDLSAPGPKQRRLWLDYVEGTAQALLARGFALRGADLLLVSDVPRGAGLSSSAALEMSVGLALATLGENSPIDRVKLALAGQAAEHEYVGTKCGIMDQYISALGQKDHALLIDCRSLEPTAVPLQLGDNVVLMCDSRVHHELASSAYNRRREECRQGVTLLERALPGIKALRDVTTEQFQEHEALLPEPVRARCRHVVTENARTLEATQALRAGDLATFGRLMVESHESLRRDYEVSCAELDTLVDIATGEPGVHGARMTGGGFGGCTVNLVATSALERVSEALRRKYAEQYGKEPQIFVSRAAQGAAQIDGL